MKATLEHKILRSTKRAQTKQGEIENKEISRCYAALRLITPYKSQIHNKDSNQ